MRFQLILPILASFVTIYPSLAQEVGSPACQGVEDLHAGRLRAQILQSRKHCILMVTAADATGSNDRWFTFNEAGMFQVQVRGGAIAYFLFPRGGAPQLTKTTTDDLEIRAAGGHLLKISGQSGLPVSSPPFGLVASKQYSVANEGGVKLVSFGGIALDCGFGRGQAGYTVRGRTCVVRDSEGATCDVPGKDVISYNPTDRSDAEFKFARDEDFAQYLSKRCPKLNLAPLRPLPTLPVGTITDETNSGNSTNSAQ